MSINNKVLVRLKSKIRPYETRIVWGFFGLMIGMFIMSALAIWLWPSL